MGDDLASGKPTLPLIHVMRHGTPNQVAVVRHAIEHGGRDELPAILDAIRETGALEEARRCAKAEADIAKGAISALPATQYRDSLLELLDFAVARRH